MIYIDMIFGGTLKLTQSINQLPEAITTASTTHDKPFRPVPRFPSLLLMSLRVLAVILTLRHLSQFFDE